MKHKTETPPTKLAAMVRRVAVVVCVALVASVFSPVGASASVDELVVTPGVWSEAAVKELGPLVGPGSVGGFAPADGVSLGCDAGVLCVVGTDRPEFDASSLEVPDGGSYRFFVMEPGEGDAVVVAEGSGVEPVWVPDAGLLDDETLYVWTALTLDADGASTDSLFGWAVVSLGGGEPVDAVGPVSVFPGGDVGVSLGTPTVLSGPTEYGLVADYRGSRVSGSTPAWNALGWDEVLGDGWRLGSSLLVGASYVGAVSFAGGDNVQLVGVDGSKVMWTRDGSGVYRADNDSPLLVAGAGSLTPTGDGGWRHVDPMGAVHVFDRNGDLVEWSVSSPADGVGMRYGFEWTAGRLASVTNLVTGDTASLTYSGLWGSCGEVPAGFDNAAGARGLLCGFENFDGSTTTFAYVDRQLAMVETPGAERSDISYGPGGHLDAVRLADGADVVAAGLYSAADASAAFTVDYQHGRVSRVMAPAGLDGARTGTEFTFGTETDGGVVTGRTVTAAEVRFDGAVEGAYTVRTDASWRPVETTDAAGTRTITEWDVVRNRPTAVIDETDGLMTVTEYDALGRTTATFGPAPSELFGPDGTPLSADMPVERTEYGPAANGGGTAIVWNGSDTTSTPAGAVHVPDLTVDIGDAIGTAATSSGIDLGSDWVASLTTTVPTPAAGSYRIGTQGAVLTINGSVCNPTSGCALQNPTVWADRPAIFGVEVTNTTPGALVVEYNPDPTADPDAWAPVDLSVGDTGAGLPTSTRVSDTLAWGAPPTELVSETRYADVALGTPGQVSVDNPADPGLPIGATYTYDPANRGRLLGVTTNGGVTTRYEYDPNGIQTATIDGHPHDNTLDGRRYTTVRDDTGRVIEQAWHDPVDGTSAVTNTSYDARDRIVTETHTSPAGETRMDIDYIVDGNPLVTRTTETTTGGGVVTTTVVAADLTGRDITAETVDTQPDAPTLVWVDHTATTDDTVTIHTSLDRVALGTIHESYDHLGRLVTLDRDGTRLATIAWDRDVITQVVDHNGVTTDIGYDHNGAAVNQTITFTDGTTITETLDTAPTSGRILTETLTDWTGDTHTWNYTHDQAGRLQGAALDSPSYGPNTWTYGYTPIDSCANPGIAADSPVTTRTHTGPDGTETWTYCHNAFGAPTSASSDTGAELPIEFDPTGRNMTRVGDTHLTYTHNDRLQQAHDDHTTVAIVRTHTGQQISRTLTTPGGTATTRNGPSGWTVDTTGNTTQTVALPNAAILAGDTTTYTSLRGHATATTDSAGVPLESTPMLYDPYGTPLHDQTETIGTGYLASDSVDTIDLATSIMLTGNRTYIPELTAFSTPDPVIGGSTTAYNYTNANPVDTKDPEGNFPWVVLAAFTLTGAGLGFIHGWVIEGKRLNDWELYGYTFGGMVIGFTAGVAAAYTFTSTAAATAAGMYSTGTLGGMIGFMLGRDAGLRFDDESLWVLVALGFMIGTIPGGATKGLLHKTTKVAKAAKTAKAAAAPTGNVARTAAPKPIKVMQRRGSTDLGVSNMKSTKVHTKNQLIKNGKTLWSDGFDKGSIMVKNNKTGAITRHAKTAATNAQGKTVYVPGDKLHLRTGSISRSQSF